MLTTLVNQVINPATILAMLLNVDGAGSGLDADLLDGQQGSYYNNLANATGTLAVANGGTGLASYTAGDLPYASGATTLSKLGIGAANTVLTSNGATPAWSNSLTLAGVILGTDPGGDHELRVNGDGFFSNGLAIGATTTGTATGTGLYVSGAYADMRFNWTNSANTGFFDFSEIGVQKAFVQYRGSTNSGGEKLEFVVNGAEPIHFANDGADRLVIGSSGAVAVESTLSVNGGVLTFTGSVNPNIAFNDGTGVGYFEISSGHMVLTPRSGRDVYLSGTKTVINSSSVFNTEFNGVGGIYSRWSVGGTAIGFIGSGDQISAGSATDFSIRSQGDITFAPNAGNLAARIDINGHTILGSSDPGGGQLLRVNGTGLFSGAITTTGNVILSTGSTSLKWNNAGNFVEVSAASGNLNLYSGTGSAALNAILTAAGNFQLSAGQLIIATTATPASASATGTVGTFNWDSNYLYICVATDTWKRAALSTW